MSAVELCHIIGVGPLKLSQAERIILEAELFSLICVELKENFRRQYHEYFSLLNFSVETEDEMLEDNFTKLVIKDILQTREYTVEGLAHYTGIHEDVIYEVMCGLNTTPSAILLQRAIDLHRVVRRELYDSIMQKIFSQYKLKD